VFPTPGRGGGIPKPVRSEISYTNIVWTYLSATDLHTDEGLHALVQRESVIISVNTSLLTLRSECAFSPLDVTDSIGSSVVIYMLSIAL
jgi:hypothetical protein